MRHYCLLDSLNDIYIYQLLNIPQDFQTNGLPWRYHIWYVSSTINSTISTIGVCNPHYYEIVPKAHLTTPKCPLKCITNDTLIILWSIFNCCNCIFFITIWSSLWMCQFSMMERNFLLICFVYFWFYELLMLIRYTVIRYVLWMMIWHNCVLSKAYIFLSRFNTNAIGFSWLLSRHSWYKMLLKRLSWHYKSTYLKYLLSYYRKHICIS